MKETPILVVNRYFTPFAAALIGMAIWLGNPSDFERNVSLILLLFGILFCCVLLQIWTGEDV